MAGRWCKDNQDGDSDLPGFENLEGLALTKRPPHGNSVNLAFNFRI
jgi:hypothetical protein